MALAQSDIDFIKAHLEEWLTEAGFSKTVIAHDVEQRERLTRVESELRQLRESTHVGFEQVDKELRQLREGTRVGFEKVDKQLDQIHKRLNEAQTRSDQRFHGVQTQFDQRFHEARTQSDQRYHEALRRQDRHFLWLSGFIATASALVIAAVRFL